MFAGSLLRLATTLTCMRNHWKGSLLALLVCGTVSACATPSDAPATERGFFGGIGAMVTGTDENRAANLERNAAAEEEKKRQLEERLAAANADAARTREQVEIAERRLAAIQTQVQRQKERLAALRAGTQSSSSAAEAVRLQNELDAIDRERRAAQDARNAVTPATLRNLEDRTRAVGNALDRLGAI
jgi:hypothetical protein